MKRYRKPCESQGCARTAQRDGYCWTCLGGTPKRECQAPGCTKWENGGRYCRSHRDMQTVLPYSKDNFRFPNIEQSRAWVEERLTEGTLEGEV